jgi:Ser/Thr protein kinase RdoA (MazF antagonist)
MPAAKIPIHVLKEVSRRYGLSENDLSLMTPDDNLDAVYEYQINHKAFVLKLVHHSDKDKTLTKNLVESELDWITYLVDNGVNTPRPIISKQGNPVELVDLDHNAFFSAISLEKATGRLLTPADLGAELFFQMGKLTGKIHSLAKRYKPGDGTLKRPEWYEDDYLDIDELIPATDTELIEKSWELVDALKGLPRDSSSYGLIHGDLQDHNLWIDEGVLTLLDFESSVYCWFMGDFAGSLEGIVGDKASGRETEIATLFFSENYWQGYHQENRLDLFYFQKIPEFFRLWELFLYNQFINEWDMANLTEKRRRLLDGYRTDIIYGARFAGIGFEQFYYS